MHYQELIDEFRGMIDALWAFLIKFVPNLVVGLIVLFAGYLLARLVQFLVSRLINSLDRAVNSRLQARLIQINFSSSRKFISRAFFWLIIFFFLVLFTEVTELVFVSDWLSRLSTYIPNLLAGILIVFIGIIVSKLVADLIVSGLQKAGFPTPGILGRITRITLLVVAIFMAAGQAGLDINFLSWLIYILLGALLFGGALAFGLGARTSVSNILASHYFSRNYAAGNVVRIGEHEGRIIKVTAVSVIIETDAGQVTIPAKEFSEKASVLIENK